MKKEERGYMSRRVREIWEQLDKQPVESENTPASKQKSRPGGWTWFKKLWRGRR